MEFQPIGVAHTPYSSVDEIPRSASEKREEVAVVEVFRDFSEGLRDLDGFSHVMLLSYLHEARETKLTVYPPFDDSGQARGVYATRSPMRPNHIGVTVVEPVKVEGRNLLVRGIDLLDETPLLDIKPYIPYDAGMSIEVGWLEGKIRCNGTVQDTDHDTDHDTDDP